jgi:F1F0 ATPase subunit 2
MIPMSQAAVLLAALIGGLALGWAFFYGLHRTVQALPQARHPARLLILSLLLRLALLGLAFWLLVAVGGQWPELLAAFVGIMLMRLILIRQLGETGPRPKGGASR